VRDDWQNQLETLTVSTALCDSKFYSLEFSLHTCASCPVISRENTAVQGTMKDYGNNNTYWQARIARDCPEELEAIKSRRRDI
jgi:hypothetical protein